MDSLKQQIANLPADQWQELLAWVVGEEKTRRDTLPAVDQARAEDAQRLWEAHPELKPKFETEPVEVDTSKEVTLDDLLAAYSAWVQPAGVHDALPTGAIVADEGRIWRNDLPTLNVWKPGTMNAGWTDITDELLDELNQPEPEGEDQDAGETTPEPEDTGVREWKPNLNVKPGERYRFQGDTYEVIQAHTSAAHWPPNAVPALYRKV